MRVWPGLNLITFFKLENQKMVPEARHGAAQRIKPLTLTKHTRAF